MVLGHHACVWKHVGAEHWNAKRTTFKELYRALTSVELVVLEWRDNSLKSETFQHGWILENGNARMVLNLSFVNPLLQFWVSISKHNPLNILNCLLNRLKHCVDVVLYLLAILIQLVRDVEMRQGRYYANARSRLVVLKLLNLLLYIVSIPYPPIREQVGYCHYLVFWNAISLGDILLQICGGHSYEVAHLHDEAYVILPFWIVECVIPSVVYWNVLA